MKYVLTVLSLALLGFLIYLITGWMVDGYFAGDIVPDGAVPDPWTAPDTWAEWRDITFVFMAAFWLLAGLMLFVLITVAVFLALTLRRLLRENVGPAVDSLRESLDSVRGTVEYTGETVVSPVIRVYSIVKGVRGGIAAVRNLPDFVRGRRKKGRRK